MLMSKTPPKSKRCARYACHKRAAYVHHKDACFAFCDEHWPAFERLMTSSRSSARFHGSMEDRKREAGQLLAEGMAPALVAQRVGVHRETAYRWRIEFGHEPKSRNPLSDAEIEQARQMLADGVAWRQIAKQLHRSAVTLKRVLAVAS